MLNGIYLEELGNSFVQIILTNRPFTREEGFVLDKRNTCYCVLLFAYILEPQFRAPAHLCHFFTNDPCVNHLEILRAFINRLGPLLSDECALESNSVITSCK
jgi:hypothetical protein